MNSKVTSRELFAKIFSKITKKAKREVRLLDLPDELLIMILSYLKDNPQALLVVSLSCRKLCRLASDNSHWSPFLLSAFQQEENAKHIFLNEIHKVQSKYLGSNHPTFSSYYEKLETMVTLIEEASAREKSLASNKIITECRKNSAFAVVVLATLSDELSPISQLLISMSPRHVIEAFMMQITRTSAVAAIYALEDPWARTYFLNSFVHTPPAYKLMVLNKTFPEVGVCFLKNRSLFWNNRWSQEDKEQIKELLSTTISRSQENVLSVLKDKVIFEFLKKDARIIFKSILQFPDLFQQILNDFELQNTLASLEESSQYLTQLEAAAKKNHTSLTLGISSI